MNKQKAEELLTSLWEEKAKLAKQADSLKEQLAFVDSDLKRLTSAINALEGNSVKAKGSKAAKRRPAKPAASRRTARTGWILADGIGSAIKGVVKSQN